MSFPSLTKTFRHDVYPSIDPTNPALSASGKTVLITGAGQGIGAAIVRAFSQAKAANIVLLGRRASTLSETKAAVEALRSNASRLHVFEADITDAPRIHAVFAEVAATIGKIDVYVANAGYQPGNGAVAGASVEDFVRGFDVNVKGGLIAAQAFLAHAAPNATLVNVSTGAVHVPPMAPAGYVGSKLAQVSLMDFVAAENPGLRVFNMSPGIVQTEMSTKSEINVPTWDTGMFCPALPFARSFPC